MADKQQDAKQEARGGRAEKDRKSGEAEQQMGQASSRMAGAAGNTMRSAAETARRGADAGEHVAMRGAEAAGEMAQRTFQSSARGAQSLFESTARHVSEATRQTARSAQQAAEDLEALMLIPSAASGHVQQVQRAMSGMMDRMVQTNMQAGQELLRFANPGTMMQLQQRFMQQYVQGLVEVSAEVLKVSRKVADDVLRPLEERTQQGQEWERDRGAKVAEVMTTGVQLASPDQTVQEVAQLMAEADTGAVPIGENDRLVGMITDRDIAIRVTAEGKDPRETRVRDVMSQEIRYCFEDDDVEDVAENMAQQQVRRLPVLDRRKRLVGILSVGDLATQQPPHVAGRALGGIARPGGQHNQAAAFAGRKPRS